MVNIVIGLNNFLMSSDNPSARPPFYDAFLSGLKNAGNNVLCFERQNYKPIISDEIPDNYLEIIKKFKPDLFIFFNNQFWNIMKHFDAPIVIYDVDSPNSYSNIDELKQNKNKLKFFVNQSSGIEQIKDIIGVQTENIKYIKPFTNINSNPNMEQNINISFLGACWIWNDFNAPLNFSQQLTTKEERDEAFKAYHRYIEQPYYDLDYFYDTKKDIKRLKFDDIKVSSARISGIKRLRYLTAIADLGLEVRGSNWNSPMLKVFPEVMLCYNIQQVLSYVETQDFFNQSKIGFNTKHIQAKSGFSWRVCDIMASNACLVTERADDLKTLGFKVPMFESASEAREICEKLLKNDNMRKDIVAHSHELIDKNHRLESSLAEIEDFLNMRLRSNIAGSLQIIQISSIKSIIKTDIPKPPEIHFPNIDKKSFNLKDSIYYKLSKHLFNKISSIRHS
ncbi:MAG: glycosyltransferase family 1 protein [Alphaproteobacteria bacterium]|nr:glycosyltransferase family 1 protein [Alphaproteobacteria bacterium]